jgi:hypothetical protein
VSTLIHPHDESGHISCLLWPLYGSVIMQHIARQGAIRQGTPVKPTPLQSAATTAHICDTADTDANLPASVCLLCTASTQIGTSASGNSAPSATKCDLMLSRQHPSPQLPNVRQLHTQRSPFAVPCALAEHDSSQTLHGCTL